MFLVVTNVIGGVLMKVNTIVAIPMDPNQQNAVRAMQKKIAYRYRFIFVLLGLSLTLCCFESSSAHGISDDSTAQEFDTLTYHRPSPLLQFVIGEATYSLAFWATGGKQYIERGWEGAQAPFLGLVLSGVAVTLSGNILSNCNGSYWAGIGGAFIGGIFGGALYQYVATRNPSSYIYPYLALSIPAVISSVLLYQLTLSNKDFEETADVKSLLFYPVISRHSTGIGIQFHY